VTEDRRKIVVRAKLGFATSGVVGISIHSLHYHDIASGFTPIILTQALMSSLFLFSLFLFQIKTLLLHLFFSLAIKGTSFFFVFF